MKIVVVRKTRVAVSKAAGVGSSPTVPAILNKQNKKMEGTKKTMKKLKYNAPHESGICPCCGSHELQYGDYENYGFGISHRWYCEKCEATGAEWYDIVFKEHDIYNTPEDHIFYEDAEGDE